MVSYPDGGDQCPKDPLMTMTPEGMLTEAEFQKLIGACENSKERAPVASILDESLRVEVVGYLL